MFGTAKVRIFISLKNFVVSHLAIQMLVLKRSSSWTNGFPAYYRGIASLKVALQGLIWLWLSLEGKKQRQRDCLIINQQEEAWLTIILGWLQDLGLGGDMHNVVLYNKLTACTFEAKLMEKINKKTCCNAGHCLEDLYKGLVGIQTMVLLVWLTGECTFVCLIEADLAFILWFFFISFLGWGAVSVCEVGMHLNRSRKTLWLVRQALWEMQSFVLYWLTSWSCHCARRWRAGQCLPLLLGYRYT